MNMHCHAIYLFPAYDANTLMYITNVLQYNSACHARNENGIDCLLWRSCVIYACNGVYIWWGYSSLVKSHAYPGQHFVEALFLEEAFSWHFHVISDTEDQRAIMGSTSYNAGNHPETCSQTLPKLIRPWQQFQLSICLTILNRISQYQNDWATEK